MLVEAQVSGKRVEIIEKLLHNHSIQKMIDKRLSVLDDINALEELGKQNILRFKFLLLKNHFIFFNSF